MDIKYLLNDPPATSIVNSSTVAITATHLAAPPPPFNHPSSTASPTPSPPLQQREYSAGSNGSAHLDSLSVLTEAAERHQSASAAPAAKLSRASRSTAIAPYAKPTESTGSGSSSPVTGSQALLPTYSAPTSSRGLTKDDITRVLEAASSNKIAMKAKRDTAMVCLLLDMKLPCQKIAALTYRDVRGIIERNFDGVVIGTRNGVGGRRLLCHPMTVQTIREWVEHCKSSYQWTYEDEAPLFVPLPVGSGSQIPRRIFLKRDAISKVFASIKNTSNVEMSKDVINMTDFSSYLPESLETTAKPEPDAK